MNDVPETKVNRYLTQNLVQEDKTAENYHTNFNIPTSQNLPNESTVTGGFALKFTCFLGEFSIRFCEIV